MNRPDRIAVALGLCALLIGAGYLGYASRGEGLGLVRVKLRETLMEPCRFPVSRERSVVVMGIATSPARAPSIDSIEISGALGDYVVTRQRQMCEVVGQGRTFREACIAEACDTGECTIRIPLEASADQAGTVRVRYRAGTWGPWVAGFLERTSREAPPPPLDVVRERDTMRVAGTPGASMRVSVMARGRVVADSPLSVDATGEASFKVPPGTERALVAASSVGGGGVSQATIHVAGPFDDSCESP